MRSNAWLENVLHFIFKIFLFHSDSGWETRGRHFLRRLPSFGLNQVKPHKKWRIGSSTHFRAALDHSGAAFAAVAAVTSWIINKFKEWLYLSFFSLCFSPLRQTSRSRKNFRLSQPFSKSTTSTHSWRPTSYVKAGRGGGWLSSQHEAVPACGGRPLRPLPPPSSWRQASGALSRHAEM